MNLIGIKILNYKCYRDSGPVALGETFTVVVGQNNAGKTAFLEAINSSSIQNKPHRVPARGPFQPVPIPTSSVHVDVSISGAELLHRMLANGDQIVFPLARAWATDPHAGVQQFFDEPKLHFELQRSAGSGWSGRSNPAHRHYKPEPNDITARVGPTSDRQSWTVHSIQQSEQGLSAYVGQYIDRSVYLFRAERLNVGESSITPTSELANDANNLPSVLLQLPNSPEAHDRYQELVREIFPLIYRVSAAPITSSTARITIIMKDGPAGQPHPGVDIPLNDSGTGISQVLAILYVAVTATAPRTLVIDEPNSFLHPGAAKKLLSILRTLQHQYIISTHSSDLINVTDPEFLHLVEWHGTEAHFLTLDRTSVHDQRRVLDELGVRVSDVFGCDRVLWVEGPTEQRCFPLLLRYIGLLSPAVAIAPLVATGDLEARRTKADLAWKIYEQLSMGTALIPPALAFSFDREGRTKSQMDNMSRRSRGIVAFLPRRTYENFLISPDAICHVLATGAQAGKRPTAKAVSDWLGAQRASGRYDEYEPTPGVAEDQWMSLVNAPKLLKDLFNELSESTCPYDKVVHSVALTEWLLANNPAHLQELLTYVANLVERKDDI